MTKPATESSLDQREAERDCYRQLATATDIDQRNGGRHIETNRVIPLHLRGCKGASCGQGDHPCTEGCLEMACTAGDDNPNLSAWTRARLQLTRLLAWFTRRR